jgi:hypothetical protein
MSRRYQRKQKMLRLAASQFVMAALAGVPVSRSVEARAVAPLGPRAAKKASNINRGNPQSGPKGASGSEDTSTPNKPHSSRGS